MRPAPGRLDQVKVAAAATPRIVLGAATRLRAAAPRGLPARLPRRRSRTTAQLLWLGLAVVAVFAAAASLTWVIARSGSRSAGEAALNGPASGAARSGSSSASSASSSSPSSGAPAPGAVPAPAGAARGAYPVFVVVRPMPSGDLDVVEEIFERTPVSSLQLNLPTSGGIAALRDIRPTVTGLSVLADGRRVPFAEGAALVSSTRLPLGAPSSTITLTYRLRGATKHTGPGPAGRVLAALPPITAGRTPSTPVVVRVTGGSVLNLVCPQLPVARQLCGHRDGDLWTTSPMSARSGRVIAQLDLTSA